MGFELSRELVDQIIFAMEDQDTDYALDLQTMEIVPAENAASDDEDRFVPLPVWQSVDGYNLMERFIGSLHNPVYRDRLRAILDSGRGVFRQFKNAVRERPEIERLWYRHKEREMRNLVIDWYGDVCEYLGIDRIEPDFAETEDLVLSDFVLREASPPIDAELAATVERLSAAAATEPFVDYPQDYRRHLEQQVGARRPALDSEAARLIYAAGPEEQLAGFIWMHFERLDSGRRIATVVQLFVQPEFRGLGIASALLSACLRSARGQGAERLLIALPGNCELLRDSLERTGFAPLNTEMELDLAAWEREAR